MILSRKLRIGYISSARPYFILYDRFTILTTGQFDLYIVSQSYVYDCSSAFIPKTAFQFHLAIYSITVLFMELLFKNLSFKLHIAEPFVIHKTRHYLSSSCKGKTVHKSSCFEIYIYYFSYRPSKKLLPFKCSVQMLLRSKV